jgi:hypothetical protein
VPSCSVDAEGYCFVCCGVLHIFLGLESVDVSDVVSEPHPPLRHHVLLLLLLLLLVVLLLLLVTSYTVLFRLLPDREPDTTFLQAI